MKLPLAERYGEDPRPMTAGEGRRLMELARRLPAEPTIVQIGAGEGLSTVALLAARPDAFVFSIDIKACGEEFEALREARLDERRVARILGDGAEAGLHWPYEVAMVFVDGDHRYEGVKRDIAAWAERPSHLLVFHDYHAARPPRLNGVREAVEEWAAHASGWNRLSLVERVCAFGRVAA